MLRHLPRYTRGIDTALRNDRLSQSDLAWLAPYLPNLGTAWMSAAAMTARTLPADDSRVVGMASADNNTPEETNEAPDSLVNKLLAGNFEVMRAHVRFSLPICML